jgi:biotin synthase-related radical SAM superfamily protein
MTYPSIYVVWVNLVGRRHWFRTARHVAAFPGTYNQSNALSISFFEHDEPTRDLCDTQIFRLYNARDTGGRTDLKSFLPAQLQPLYERGHKAVQTYRQWWNDTGTDL